MGGAHCECVGKVYLRFSAEDKADKCIRIAQRQSFKVIQSGAKEKSSGFDSPSFLTISFL